MAYNYKHKHTHMHTHNITQYTYKHYYKNTHTHTFAGGPLEAAGHTQNTDKILLHHDQILLVQTTLDNTEYHNMASRYAAVYISSQYNSS